MVRLFSRLKIFLVLLVIASGAFFYFNKQTVSPLQETFSEKQVKTAEGINHYRSFLQHPLNAGLPRSLLDDVKEIEKEYQSNNIILLLIHKSVVNLDLKRPGDFLKNLADNYHNSYSLGHVQLAWSCELINGSYKSATGFTGEMSEQSMELAKSGWGATTLFARYKDGYFEKPWDVHLRSVKSQEGGKLVKLAMVTDEEDCAQLLKSLKSDLMSKSRLEFTLTDQLANPSEGANCVSFVFSHLKKLGNFPQAIVENSVVNLKIPSVYFGISDHDLPAKTRFKADDIESVKTHNTGIRKVSITSLFELRDLRGEAPINISFLDPQSLAQWVEANYKVNFPRHNLSVIDIRQKP